MPITVKLKKSPKIQGINQVYQNQINKFHSNELNKEEEEEEVVKRIEPYITTFMTNYNQKETVINTFLDKDENKNKDYNNYFSVNSAIYFGLNLNNLEETKGQMDEINVEKNIVEPCIDMIKYTRIADSAIMPCKSVIDLIRQIDTPISFPVVEVRLSEEEVEKELKKYFDDSVNNKTKIYEFLKPKEEERLGEKWIVFLNKKGAYVFYDIVSNQCQFNYPGKDFGVSYDDGPNFIKLPGTVQNKNIENIDLNLYKCITSPYAICKIMKILYEENNKNRQILKLDSLEKKWVVLLSPNNKQYYRLDLTTNITEWIQESNTLPPSSPFALLTNNPYDTRIVVNRVPTTPPDNPVIPAENLIGMKPKNGPLESPVGLVTTTLPPDNHVIPARSMKLDSRFHIVLPKGT